MVRSPLEVCSQYHVYQGSRSVTGGSEPGTSISEFSESHARLQCASLRQMNLNIDYPFDGLCEVDRVFTWMGALCFQPGEAVRSKRELGVVRKEYLMWTSVMFYRR